MTVNVASRCPRICPPPWPATRGRGRPSRRCLDRGEPLAALGTRATPTDQLTVLGFTRVHHARVGVATVRAAHRDLPFERTPTVSGHAETQRRGDRHQRATV